MEIRKKLAENIQQDSKSFFSYARGNSKSKVGPLKNPDGEDITDTAELANVLNDHFSTVFTMEDGGEIPVAELMFKGEPGDKLCTVSIDDGVIEKKLQQLHPDKADGDDGLLPEGD